MKYTFKGNFGTLELVVDADGTARGTYQKDGMLKGTWSEGNFNGEWSNQGMEGLVNFTVSDGKLEGNWKKGKEAGAMKGKWKGEVVAQEGTESTPAVKESTPSEPEPTTASPTEALKAEIEKLYEAENYAEVISVFEANETVAGTDQNIAHKYLFSLWFHGDLEEKTFERIQEFEDKFENYDRWRKLKGWYYSHKGWHDSALRMFEGSSERHYNRTKKIFDDFETLCDAEEYEKAIQYYENNLTQSISEDTLYIAEHYCSALYRNSGTAKKGLREVRKFIKRYPDFLPFQKLEGQTLSWIGLEEEDIDPLKEALAIFKRLKDQSNQERAQKRIAEVKTKQKEKAAEEKRKAKELAKLEREEAKAAVAEKKRKEAEEKRRARELAELEKEEAKAAAAASKMLEHRFKTSRGLNFCQYCGEERQWAGSECYKRKAGHNFIMQKVGGDWEPVCTRCAQEAKWSGMDYCK